MSAFDEWYNGWVGFEVNSERIYDEVLCSSPSERENQLEKWMKVCWNNALEAAQNTLVHGSYFYDGGPSWDDDDYFFCNPKKDIEDLKAAP